MELCFVAGTETSVCHGETQIAKNEKQWRKKNNLLQNGRKALAADGLGEEKKKRENRRITAWEENALADRC